jgi:hypothetical protein
MLTEIKTMLPMFDEMNVSATEVRALPTVQPVATAPMARIDASQREEAEMIFPPSALPLPCTVQRRTGLAPGAYDPV